MLNSNQNTEKQDLLITPNLQPNQLPSFLEQAIEGNNGKQVYIPTNFSASALLKMMDELKATPMGERRQYAPTTVLPNASHGVHQTGRREASRSP